MSSPEHYPFGGSGAHRWLNCHGAPRLAATLPPLPSSPAAERGTYAHALLAYALLNGEDDVLSFEGVAVAPGHDLTFTAEDVEAVQKAVDYVRALLARMPGAEIYVEVQRKLEDEVGGTADIVVYDPTTQTTYVIDYKHGSGVYVSEIDNKQLKFYMLLAVVALNLPVKTLIGVIIQPRFGDGTYAVREAEPMDLGDLLDFHGEIRNAVDNGRSANPKFVEGDWCDWCPAASVCPLKTAMAKAVLDTWGPNYAPWTPPNGTAVTITLPDPASCRDPAKLADTKRGLDLIEAWGKIVEARLFEAAMTGTNLEPYGFKLVKKIARRKWTDEDKAASIAASIGLPPAEYQPPKLLSVAQMEKLVKAKKINGGYDKLAAAVDKTSSGFNLVPADAKGEAVNPLELAAASFGDVSIPET